MACGCDLCGYGKHVTFFGDIAQGGKSGRHSLDATLGKNVPPERDTRTPLQ